MLTSFSHNPTASGCIVSCATSTSRAADQVEEAVELTERALELCASQGDRHREAALHNNLADRLHSLGRAEAAMTHLKRAVAVFAEVGLDPADQNAWRPEIWKLTEW